MRGRWGFIGVGITGEGEPERLGPSGAAPGPRVSGTECGERRPLTVVPSHGPGAAAGGGGAGARRDAGDARGRRHRLRPASPCTRVLMEPDPLGVGPCGT